MICSYIFLQLGSCEFASSLTLRSPNVCVEEIQFFLLFSCCTLPSLHRLSRLQFRKGDIVAFGEERETELVLPMAIHCEMQNERACCEENTCPASTTPREQ